MAYDRISIKEVNALPPGNVEMVKILAPVISDPKNAHNWLSFLELTEDTEVVQILSQLCENPNHKMVEILKFSIKYATRCGFQDIVAILTPYIEQS